MPGLRGRWLLAAATAWLAVLLAAGIPSPAAAHALLLRSEPAPGAAVSADQPPKRLSLWFSEPVSVSRNAIAVLDAGGRRLDLLDAAVGADDASRVDVGLASLPQGAYTVRWQVTSVDNHVVHGTFWFAVGFAAAPPPAQSLLGSGAPPVAWIEVLGRWLVYAAVLVLAGWPPFDLLVWRPLGIPLPETGRRLRVAWRAAIGALAAGQLLWAGAQVQAVAGVPLPQALSPAVLGTALGSSRFAILWWARLALGLALGGVLLAGAGRAPKAPRRDWLAAGLGLLLLLSISLGGHGIGARVLPPLAVAVDVLHLAAAALWLGGLLQLAIVLPAALAPRTSEGGRPPLLQVLVPRLSGVALWSVLVLVATGAFSTWEQVATVRALTSTPYGQSLLLKLALLLPVLGIAAVNLLVVRPRAASRDRGLARGFQALLRGEVVMGAAVLLSVGLLTVLPPPAQQTVPAPVAAARQAGDLSVGLAVAPNWVGVSRFRVSLADAQGRVPAGVQSVVLTFAMQGMNMGRTTVVMTPRGGGVYETEGFYVGMPGVSLVGVSVSRSGAADENAVFQFEVPDLNQRQLSGLRPSVGVGPVGLLGLAGGLFGALALLIAPRGTLRLAPAAALLAVLAGGGAFVADRTASTAASAASGSNPPPATQATLGGGRLLFGQNCAVCHGETGVGNGPAAASLLPAPSDLTLHARWHSDEQLFWFITNGVAGTAMPSFAQSLTARQRWDVISYLHVLASAPTATVPVAPAAPGPVAGAPPAPRAVPAAILPPGRAQAPSLADLNGRIVFGPDTDHDLWVIGLPEGRPQRITSFGRLEFPSSPAWSPDGRQIAYSFYRLPSGGGIPVPPGTDVYVMNADGSGQRPVATHDAQGAVLQNPAWSPDGRALYVGYFGYQQPNGGLDIGIDRVDVASGTRTRVVSNAIAPAISRDGRYLAYTRLPVGEVRSFTLWRSAADGSAPVQLIGPDVFTKYEGLRFSPDGRRLVFAAVGSGQGYAPASAARSGYLSGLLGRLFSSPVAYADGDLWDLWTIGVDGRNLQRITAINEDLPVMAWSADGLYVAFLGGGSATTAQAGVSVMDARGGDILRLTTQPGHRGLDWTPGP